MTEPDDDAEDPGWPWLWDLNPEDGEPWEETYEAEAD